MAGIREQKKERTRQEILKAAEGLFREKGYENVSMEEIAQAAFVGTGTLYNYFNSKDEIFVAAVDIINQAAESDNSIEQYEFSKGSNTSEIVIEYLEKQIKKYEWLMTNTLMKSLVKAIFNSAVSGNKLVNTLIKADYNLIDNIERLLKKLSENNLFEENPRVVAELIYAALMYEWLMYIYLENGTVEDVKRAVKEKIRVILK